MSWEDWRCPCPECMGYGPPDPSDDETPLYPAMPLREFTEEFVEVPEPTR